MSSAPVSHPGHIDFAGSPRPTLGVEWEFALVDADTRDVSNEAAEVIVELGENNPHVHKELLRNTVEIVTGICDSVPEAMDDLRSTLTAARKIVRARGMELFFVHVELDDRPARFRDRQFRPEHAVDRQRP